MSAGYWHPFDAIMAPGDRTTVSWHFDVRSSVTGVTGRPENDTSFEVDAPDGSLIDENSLQITNEGGDNSSHSVTLEAIERKPTAIPGVAIPIPILVKARLRARVRSGDIGNGGEYYGDATVSVVQYR